MTLLRHEYIGFIPADNVEVSQNIAEEIKTRKTIPHEAPKIISNATKKVKLQIKVDNIILQLKRQSEFVDLQIPAQKLLAENEDIPNTENIGTPTRNTTSLSNMLNWKPKERIKSDRIFWISYIVNNGTSSRKIMKMVNHNEVDKLIKKLKTENKTSKGKLNTLTAWEIYKPSEFMEEQVANPDYVHSTSSNLFNVVPYYSSSKDLVASN